MATINAYIEKKEVNVFAFSIFLLLFWVLGQSLDLQANKVLGTIFAFFWIPMIIMLFILPVINLTMVMKKGIRIKSYWIYGLFFNLLTIILLCTLP